MTIDEIVKGVMNMTPNDCAIMIAEKNEKINKLERTVETLRKKCNRYEKQLTKLYLNGDFK